MKKGINRWCFPKEMSIQECLKIAKEAKFEGIELCLAESGELSLDSPQKEVKRIKNFADKIGIEICSLATGLHWKYNLIDSDKTVREKSIAITEKMLEIASSLGADTILVIPGIVKEDVFYVDAYQRALEIIQYLGEKASQQKINIGLENGGNKFLITPVEYRDFIDKIDNKFVGAYLDTANTMLDGYPEQWIRILGKNRIKKIHFKDYTGYFPYPYTHLLQGDVNWKAVMQKLKDIKYEDCLIAEVLPYKQFYKRGIYNTSDSMDFLLNLNK